MHVCENSSRGRTAGRPCSCWPSSTVPSTVRIGPRNARAHNMLRRLHLAFEPALAWSDSLHARHGNQNLQAQRCSDSPSLAHLNLFFAKEYNRVPKMAMLLPAIPSGVTAVLKTMTEVMMITTLFIVFETAWETGSSFQ